MRFIHYFFSLNSSFECRISFNKISVKACHEIELLDTWIALYFCHVIHLYLRQSKKTLQLSSETEYHWLASSASMLSDRQPVFEQKPKTGLCFSFSHLCSATERVCKSKPLNSIPIPRGKCEPASPQGKRKGTFLKWVFCIHWERIPTTLSSEKAL